MSRRTAALDRAAGESGPRAPLPSGSRERSARRCHTRRPRSATRRAPIGPTRGTIPGADSVPENRASGRTLDSFGVGKDSVGEIIRGDPFRPAKWGGTMYPLARRALRKTRGAGAKEHGRAMPITIYGIKNCDTMKKARAWLEKHGVDYDFHDYKAAGIEK